MAADCPAVPRRNCEGDGAAPWQLTPPLDHVQVATVRAVGLSRSYGCGHHAEETPLLACTCVRVPIYHSPEM